MREHAGVGPAAAQVHREAVVLDEQLDALPLPVGKPVQQVGVLLDPGVGAGGQVRATDAGLQKAAQVVEIVPV